MEIIEHKKTECPSGYANYTDPVHRMASDINRQEITMQAAIEADCYVYALIEEDIEFGLDPWRVLEGIDPYVDGSAFDIWFENGACVNVKPDQKRFRFFVDKRAAQ